MTAEYLKDLLARHLEGDDEATIELLDNIEDIVRMAVVLKENYSG